MAELVLNVHNNKAQSNINIIFNSEIFNPKKKRILFLSKVDDLGKIIQLGLELLCEWQVVTAKPTTNVIAVAEVVKPDIILLDTVIDDPDVFKIIEKLVSHQATKATPILLLVETMRYQNYPYCDLGVVAAIPKPFDLIDLAIEISLHLNWDQSLL